MPHLPNTWRLHETQHKNKAFQTGTYSPTRPHEALLQEATVSVSPLCLRTLSDLHQGKPWALWTKEEVARRLGVFPWVQQS